MWEQLISGFATLAVVMTLVGLIFKMKSKEIETMKTDLKEAITQIRQDFQQSQADSRADFKEALKEIQEDKVNKEALELINKHNEGKFKVLFEKSDEQMKLMNDIHTDVVVIKKGMNGEAP